MLAFVSEEQYKNTSGRGDYGIHQWEGTCISAIKTDVCWLGGEKNWYIKLTLEEYLYMAATSY